MKKTFCDICGKEIGAGDLKYPEENDETFVAYIKKVKNGVHSIPFYESIDICFSCMNKFCMFVREEMHQ